VTPEEIRERLGLSEGELKKEIATLRHCDLLKGCKENGVVYFISSETS